MVNLSGDVAFQAAHDLALGAPFVQPTLDIYFCSRVGTHTTQNNYVQCAVRLPVPATIQPVALYFATGCRDHALSHSVK